MVTDAMITIDPHLATSNHFDLSKAMEPVVNVAWSPLLLAAAFLILAIRRLDGRRLRG